MAESINQWVELKLYTQEAFVNALDEHLIALGALAITLQDAGDEPIYEPSPDTPRVWEQTILVALFEASHDLTPTLRYVEAETNLQHIQHSEVRYFKDENWVRKSLDQFKPLKLGDKLWICPSWLAIPDPNATNILLDPGLAFGTGSHPTTALCLSWLEKNINPHDIVIDYGCGSGILAIAALKLGATHAYAIDHDEQALEATQHNASLNHIPSQQLTMALPNNITLPKVSVLIANILAAPLIELAPYFASLLTQDSKIALSGILKTQASAVLKAYETWFTMDPIATEGDWVRVSGQKK